MSKISCQDKPPAIPFAFRGIQVNCCKFTKCENFGLTPEGIKDIENLNNHNKKGKGRQAIKHTKYYTISGTGKKSSAIKCKGCIAYASKSPFDNQKFYSLKSNKGIYEELQRISAYLVEPGTQCTNIDCPSNSGDEPASIKKRGKTPKGNQRYLCNVCGTSFTGKVSIQT